MRDLIRDECGVDTQQQRYIVVGCQDVPHFDAVEKGEKVDVKAVTPGMEKKALEVIAANPNIRAILMECTELPPYSDALRAKLNLPVPRNSSCRHTAQFLLFPPRVPPLHRCTTRSRRATSS